MQHTPSAIELANVEAKNPQHATKAVRFGQPAAPLESEAEDDDMIVDSTIVSTSIRPLCLLALGNVVSYRN